MTLLQLFMRESPTSADISFKMTQKGIFLENVFTFKRATEVAACSFSLCWVRLGCCFFTS